MVDGRAEAGELKLVGVFDTNSQGRNPGNPNCFLFPLPNGAWRVYRFSPGVAEAETWTQDGEGWTTCYFNRRPDLALAAKTARWHRGPRRQGLRLQEPGRRCKGCQGLGPSRNGH